MVGALSVLSVLSPDIGVNKTAKTTETSLGALKLDTQPGKCSDVFRACL